jgi:pyruvate/oxaloacetate carboxyltransferase
MNEPDEADRPMSEAEFNEAIKDPEFFAQQVAGWRRMLAGEFGEIPAEVREALTRGVRKADEQAAIRLVDGKMRALSDVIERPGGTMRAEDRLAQMQALVEEITDALLETPEPHRTSLLKDFLPVRESVRQMKIE